MDPRILRTSVGSSLHTPQPAPGQPTPDTAWLTTHGPTVFLRTCQISRFCASALPSPAEILTVLSPWHPPICPLALKDAQIAKEQAILGLAVAAQSTPQHTQVPPQHLHVFCIGRVDDQRLSESACQ